MHTPKSGRQCFCHIHLYCFCPPPLSPSFSLWAILELLFLQWRKWDDALIFIGSDNC